MVGIGGFESVTGAHGSGWMILLTSGPAEQKKIKNLG